MLTWTRNTGWDTGKGWIIINQNAIIILFNNFLLIYKKWLFSALEYKHWLTITYYYINNKV